MSAELNVELGGGQRLRTLGELRRVRRVKLDAHVNAGVLDERVHLALGRLADGSLAGAGGVHRLGGQCQALDVLRHALEVRPVPALGLGVGGVVGFINEATGRRPADVERIPEATALIHVLRAPIKQRVQGAVVVERPDDVVIVVRSLGKFLNV
jgi:hypothetical protein